MADYPKEVQLFRLIGRLGRGMGDTIDLGGDADLAPLKGARIICTPDLKAGDGGPVFKSLSSSPPVTVFQESVLGTTNADGDLVAALLDDDGKTFAPVDPSQVGISLPFGGSPTIKPTGWTWTITISVGGNFPDRVFSVYGSAGGTVDVTTLVPVPADPGASVADWQAVVATAQAAAKQAGDFANAANNSLQATPSSAAINGDNLVLTRQDGSTLSVGNVRGPKGDKGAVGDPTPYMKLLDGDGPTWQVVFDDGTPPFVTATEADGITSKVKQLAGLAASGARFEELTADSGYSFAIVYENPATKVWNLQYGIRDDGSMYQPSVSAAGVPMLPGPDVVCVGDSLTAGAGGNGTSYPGVLQQLLTASGRPGVVRNLGVGGEQSSDMAARYAGGTMLAMPAGGVWPDQGSVDVVVTNDDKASTASFIVQNNVGLNPCTFAGVPGTWSLAWSAASSKYVATRNAAGTAFAVTKPAPIISAASKDRASDILIVWAGRNNATQTARVLSDIATMVNHQRAATPIWLVIGILNGAGEGIGTSVYNAVTASAATEKQLYGRRFIDARRYLIDYGLQDAKITPTAQDTADVSADIVPSSLRSDAIHLNAIGYQLVGQLVYDRLVEIGTN